MYVCRAYVMMMPLLSSRLILIADKDKVYDKFPIPLINRLEKHLVTTSTILLPDQQEALHILEEWVDNFTKVKGCICSISVPCVMIISVLFVAVLHNTIWFLSIDSRRVMHLLDFSRKLQPLWSFKQVSLPVEHWIHGMKM